MTQHTTARESGESPGHGPFSLVVAGVGFEPIRLSRRFLTDRAETAADLDFPCGLSDLGAPVEPSAKGSLPGDDMTGQVREDAAEALAAE
jgi:hypothetical protein